MCKGDKCIGPFWVVWDKIVGPATPFDSKDVVIVDNVYHNNVDRESAWETIKVENKYPDKDSQHYPHGEVVFDANKHRFVVTGSPKLMHDATFQRKLIRAYGLNSFTEFVKE